MINGLHSLLFTLFFFITTVSSAQQVVYDLLYKVIDPKSKVEGYLFGSMHIKDRMVFNFPDSLYFGITACDAFANEVQLDSFMVAYLEQMKLEDGFGDLFKKSEEFDPSGNSKPVVKEENEKMMAPMDAYLMEMAKRQGKEIYGLESIAASLEKLAASDDLSIDYFKSQEHNPLYVLMKKTFAEGSLVDLESLLGGESFYDEELIRRNKIQANSIDRILQEKSLFAVVGAAHLFGTDNVIDLLKEKGYLVKKVMATYEENLTIDNYPDDGGDWFAHQGIDSEYSIEFPAVPVDLKMEGVSMLAAASIGTGNIYYFMDFPADPSMKIDFLINAMGESYEKQGYRLLNSKEIKHASGFPAGVAFFEDLSSELKYLKLQIVLGNGKAYLVMIGSMEKASLKHSKNDQFFNSLKIIETDSEWKSFEYKKYGYQVTMPNNSVFRTQETDDVDGNTYSINLLQGADDKGGFITRQNNFPKGMELKSDSLMLKGSSDMLIENMSSEPESIVYEDFQGYPSVFVTVRSGESLTKFRIISRGNQTYVLYGTGKEKDVDDYLDSFSFIPINAIDFESLTLFDGALTMNLPPNRDTVDRESSSWKVTRAESDRVVYTTDEASGILLQMQEEVMSKYLGLPPMDSTYNFYVSNFLEENGDSLIRDSTLMLGDLKCREIITGNKRRNTLNRVLFAVRNNKRYSLSGSFPKEILNSGLLDQIFYSIKFNEPYDEALDPFAPKGDFLLDGILSKDSMVHAKARAGIDQYYMKESDLNRIHQLMAERDTQKLSIADRELMISQMDYINDENSLAVLEKIWINIEEPIDIRSAAMLELLDFNKEESWNVFFDGLQTREVALADGGYYYNIFNPISDSTELYLKYFDQILKQNEQQNLVGIQYHLATDCIKDTTGAPRLSMEQVAILEERAPSYFNKSTFTYNDYYSHKSILNFLTVSKRHSMADSLAQKMLQQFEAPDHYVKRALTHLLEQNQTISPERLTQLLDAPKFYNLTLNKFLEYNKAALFEKKYLDHHRVGEAELKAEFLQYDGDEIQLNFKEKKVIEYKNEKVKLLCYTYNYPDEDKLYPAIVGPFPMKKSLIKVPEELTTWSYNALEEGEFSKAIEELIQSVLDYQANKEE